MAGTTQLKTQWRCTEKGCPEHGEGTARQADKAAERHGKAARHATVTWSEPPLPIEPVRPTRRR